MAAYRAVIQGMRGEASRLGSKASGVRASAATWKTRIEVSYFGNPDDPQVSVAAVSASSGRTLRTLYQGPESGLLDGGK